MSTRSGHGRLHPEGHLVLSDAGLRFGVGHLVGLFLIELLRGVEHFRALSASSPWGCRNSTGSPCERSRTPWYLLGRKPSPRVSCKDLRIALALQELVDDDEVRQILVLGAGA